MELGIKKIKGFEWILREGTLDEYVVKENCYESCGFDADDVWLDIGANIGTFPVKYGEKVKSIISFEPDEQNLSLLGEHLKINGIENCVVVGKAVVHDDAETVSFFLNNKKNKGAHSMLVKRGRTEVVVPAININEILGIYKPNKLKIDIEGGEYELLKAINEDYWPTIDEIIFEFHINILRDSNGEKLSELYGILNKHFKTIIGKDPNDLGKNWITIVHCKK